MTENKFIKLLNECSDDIQKIFYESDNDFGDYIEANGIKSQDEKIIEAKKEMELAWLNFSKTKYLDKVIGKDFEDARSIFRMLFVKELLPNLPKELEDIKVVKTEIVDGDEAVLILYSPSLGYYVKSSTYWSSYGGISHDDWSNFFSVKAVDRITRYYE